MAIGLTGLAGCGKSSVSKYLSDTYGYERAKFSGALKEMTRAFLRYRGVEENTIERLIEGDLKEVPSDFFNGRTPRYFMQRLGTEFGRELIHDNIWVDAAIDHIRGKPLVVFDDCRFANEAYAIWKQNGYVVHIERPDNNLDVGEHPSEVIDFGSDIELLNDGSLEDLFHAVDYHLNLTPRNEAA